MPTEEQALYITLWVAPREEQPLYIAVFYYFGLFFFLILDVI